MVAFWSGPSGRHRAPQPTAGPPSGRGCAAACPGPPRPRSSASAECARSSPQPRRPSIGPVSSYASSSTNASNVNQWSLSTRRPPGRRDRQRRHLGDSARRAASTSRHNATAPHRQERATSPDASYEAQGPWGASATRRRSRCAAPTTSHAGAGGPDLPRLRSPCRVSTRPRRHDEGARCMISTPRSGRKVPPSRARTGNGRREAASERSASSRAICGM